MRNGNFHNVVSTFTNVVKLDIENGNVVSTLYNVVHVNVEIHNVALTLIWRCPASRRRINQKTTLKQRWNVCWGGTWDPGPFTWVLSSGTQDPRAIDKTQNPGPYRGTRDLGPSTWGDTSPVTWNPICGNRDPIPLHGMRNPYLGTLTLMQLSLNVQFSSVA